MILLLDLGLSYADIARYLLLDDQTIRNYEKRYLSSGVKGLLSDNYVGCASKLTSEQEEQLKEHFRENTYSTAKEIVEYVKQTFGVVYTPEGMVHTLNRLHFIL
ncbi:MAG: helix-turn-helix domain-containing protein [Planctomycetes bacterium]|nr:helix-turn-helix domain-containing protein [Planctomycetota bacterium]